MIREGVTDATAAEKLSISRAHLTRLRLGQRTPSLGLASRIEAWSRGQVKPGDWLPGEVAP